MFESTITHLVINFITVNRPNHFNFLRWSPLDPRLVIKWFLSWFSYRKCLNLNTKKIRIFFVWRFFSLTLKIKWWRSIKLCFELTGLQQTLSWISSIIFHLLRPVCNRFIMTAGCFRSTTQQTLGLSFYSK